MWNENDYKNVSDFLIKEYGDTEKAVVLMGHGTEHRANDVYLKLSDILEGHNIFVGTVENKPDIYDVLNKTENFKDIVLVPFMVVAGDHAVNDMAGDDDDSWKKCYGKCRQKCRSCLKRCRRIFANKTNLLRTY